MSTPNPENSNMEFIKKVNDYYYYRNADGEYYRVQYSNQGRPLTSRKVDSNEEMKRVGLIKNVNIKPSPQKNLRNTGTSKSRQSVQTAANKVTVGTQTQPGFSLTPGYWKPSDGEFTPLAGAQPFNDIESAKQWMKQQQAPQPYSITESIPFNRQHIRDNRSEYKTVDDYYNYINEAGRDTPEGKIWLNYANPDTGLLDREVFDKIMTLGGGVSGNIGRRDAGRLANILNYLNNSAIEGTSEWNEVHNGLVDYLKENPGAVNHYWQPDVAKKVNDWLQPTPTSRSVNYPSPGSTYITTRTNNSGQLKPAEPLITQYADSPGFINPQFQSFIESQSWYKPYLRYSNVEDQERPYLGQRTNSHKQGGRLLAKNPINRFKQLKNR